MKYSPSIVNRIENLRRTVNIGKLQIKSINNQPRSSYYVIIYFFIHLFFIPVNFQHQQKILLVDKILTS